MKSDSAHAQAMYTAVSQLYTKLRSLVNWRIIKYITWGYIMMIAGKMVIADIWHQRIEGKYRKFSYSIDISIGIKALTREEGGSSLWSDLGQCKGISQV